ncbi:hypothetical protein ACP70R_010764 [Stipagrostis hirtigluma subsp. patula]
MVVRRLGGAGRALLTLPNIRRRASNSWAAVRDTFFSTKQHTCCRKKTPASLLLLMEEGGRGISPEQGRAAALPCLTGGSAPESHRIVFTVGTSVASVLTAWAGYSLRHMQQARIDRRLQSIEESLKDNHKVEHEEIKKIVTSSNISTPACVATALTTTVVGVCPRMARWSLVRSKGLPKRATEDDGSYEVTKMALATLQ